MTIVIAAFYHFFDFPHFAAMRAPMLREMNKRGIKGSVLIAPEGINSTLAGARDAVDGFLDYIKHEVVKGELEHKESYTDVMPFGRAKVRLKKETISIGEPTSLAHVGKYVAVSEWNDLISDPDTIVLDSRNDYEVHLGTFDRAINPNIHTFRELPEFIRQSLAANKKARIATFCTGGIRCEKLTSWMSGQGFEEVYHLKGGILKYLEEVPEPKSKWHGECYVFDERIAVGHGLKPSTTATSCNPCGHTLTPQDRAHTAYVEGVSCGYCAAGAGADS